MAVYPIIMCGGAGSRLWPASRPSTPKQFLPLIGPRSTFQQTLARVAGVSDMRSIIVVAGASHQAAIADQLTAINAQASLLLEPEGRDSAPAMAAAAAWVIQKDPEAVMIVVAADHHVPDAAAFQLALDQAVLVARQGWITTLGIRPNGPSTAYGYIKPGEAMCGAYVVEAFVEKPDLRTAMGYVESGYLWNSGNFVVRADLLLRELSASAPDIVAAVEAAMACGVSQGDKVFTLGAPFKTAPKISIDYAVMEKTKRAAVLPVTFEWSDLGAWDAIKAASPADADGNVVQGDVILEGARDNLVQASDRMMVAVVGVRDLAIIVENDAVLVCRLDKSQDVKRVVDRLKLEGRPQSDRGTLSAAETLQDFARRYDVWLTTAALPLWWALGADHKAGGFHETLNGDASPTAAPRRARGQARQSFVFAFANSLGCGGPWRGAADFGFRNFVDRYRLPNGLFRTLAASDGTAMDDTAVLYDQAFALLSMAALYTAEPERADLPEHAVALLGTIEANFAHTAGGFRESTHEPFASNPHMHMLEAAMAWAEAGGGEVWDKLAERIVALALNHFIDAQQGFLREYFDAEWRPAPGAPGRTVEPGHQFEWAWLLDRWSERSGDMAARVAARRLFAIASSRVDAARDVAPDELDDSLKVVRASARLWPQTERLKAAVRLAASAAACDADFYRDQALSACRGLWRYLDVPVRGLWRDKQRPDGGFIDEPAPASSFYHLICAVAELKSFAGTG
jgi:mannose-1-phosphate guanylyltransferase/mannose-6-phosphate isomerase